MITFEDCATQVTLDSIQKAEEELNIRFPLELKKHYLKFNGGLPSNSFLFDNCINQIIQVKRFFPIGIVERCSLSVVTYYKKIVSHSRSMKHLIPFAIDCQDRLLVIHRESQNIFLVDLSQKEISFEKGSIRFVIQGFDNFIERLDEIDEFSYSYSLSSY